jgi:hypothetical protein
VSNLDLDGYSLSEMHRLGEHAESLNLLIQGLVPRRIVSKVEKGAYLSPACRGKSGRSELELQIRCALSGSDESQ